MEAELPVTLVVRAANQRYDDLSVSCFLDWSIMKLKQHISVAYPTKPELEHQKLIYSGKLLQDHEILQDILINIGESDDRPHTVHLVCTQMMESPHPPPVNDEGLRCRKKTVPEEASTSEAVPPPADTQSTQETHPPTVSPQQMQYWQQQMAAARSNPYMYQMMAYQQQMMAYQQAYYMQYAQYMAAQQQDRIASGNEVQDQPRVPLNQNVQMGAGAGGEDVVDDDDDMRPRDWLDGVYMGIRLLLLANIIYFYSSFSRFAVVCAVVISFYLLYNYVKKNRMAERNRRRQEERQAREEEQRRQAEEERRRAENNNNENPEVEEEPQAPAPEDEGNENPEVQRWTAARIFDVAKTFVVTFFTSLVPDPAPLN